MTWDFAKNLRSMPAIIFRISKKYGKKYSKTISVLI